MTTRASDRGFAVIELILIAGIIPLFLFAFAGVFASSGALADDARLRLRAQEDLRRNLESITNVLRECDSATLDNFVNDKTENPYFQRVTGADAWGRVHAGEEEIRWIPYTTGPEGVASPGYLAHVQAGVPVILADRVPGGSFTVVREGLALRVTLETWYSVENTLVVAQGSTEVTLRN